jgi:hypothetical protein
MNPYKFEIKEIEGKRVINFANNSSDFIEVVFAIDEKEVKEGKYPSEKTRGYAYPPKLEKPVKKMKDETPLMFNPRGGKVTAYIFAGIGSYKDEDLDKPRFIRHKLVDKIRFKRMSNKPVEVLEVSY